MTQSQPVVRVAQLLESAGYRSLPLPFTVAGVPFDFAALLVGSNRSLDLVVVIDTLTDPESRIRQKLESISRALDLVSSRRALTIILVGPPPRATILEALAKVGRVLVVGTPTGEGADRSVKDALAVLLPLDLPDASESVVDPFIEVRKWLPPTDHDDTLTAVLDASFQGPDAVREAFRAILVEPLNLESKKDEL
jgi:hypothetical protein